MKKYIFLFVVILLSLSAKSQIACVEDVTDFKGTTYNSCWIKIFPIFSISDTTVSVRAISYPNKTVADACCTFGVYFNEINYAISFPIAYANIDSIDFYSIEALIDTLISDNTWSADSLTNEYK